MLKGLEKIISANPKLAVVVGAILGWLTERLDLIHKAVDSVSKP